MHGPINVKSPNNTSKWQIGFNSAFKGLKVYIKYNPLKSYFFRQLRSELYKKWGSTS
jgi:hypothetical protein